MRAKRPEHRRVYVEARDAETKRRVCATFYDCTPEQVIDRLKESADDDKPRKRREPQAV